MWTHRHDTYVLSQSRLHFMRVSLSHSKLDAPFKAITCLRIITFFRFLQYESKPVILVSTYVGALQTGISNGWFSMHLIICLLEEMQFFQQIKGTYVQSHTQNVLSNQYARIEKNRLVYQFTTSVFYSFDDDCAWWQVSCLKTTAEENSNTYRVWIL